MGTISGDEPCAVHENHDPIPYDTELHHVWPKGMGGPDVPENLVPVCGTGHNNIHAILRYLVRRKGKTSAAYLRRFHAGEVRYATLGFQRSVRGSL